MKLPPKIDQFIQNFLKKAGPLIAEMKTKIRKRKFKKLTPKQVVKLVRILAFAGVAALLLFVVMFFVYAKNLPDPDKINSRDVIESTKIYDRTGLTLYEIHGEIKRTLIGFDEMPQNIKEATIALEDANFYNHKGLDLKGIARGLFRTATSTRTEGGSSITQQLVKNALLTREKTLPRKFKELILTVQIERRISKDDILKLYLNEIPYGQNAYGIEAAAQTYFGKHAKDLTLAEAAYMAAIPQRPSYFNPYGSHREELDARQDYALQRMADLGYISQQEADEAKQVQVTFNAARTGIKAPHFVIYIQELLEERYGKDALEEHGFKVTTTLDYELQKMAEETVAANADRLTQYGASNAGLVAIDPKTGEILAMVGSKDFFDTENQGQVNIAVRPKQPGSSFKPYVYATALEQGMSPATMLMDVRTAFGTSGNGEAYAPQNYTGAEFGPTSIRKALAGSLNISAVKALALVGVKEAINTANKMGITSELSADRCGLSLVLGGCEVHLLDHTAAFAVFANGGLKHETKPILKIEDNKGEIVYEIKPEDDEGEQVINEEVAYLMSDIMSDNAARTYIFGAGNHLTLPDRPVAAKTGTTQQWRDGWTMGFTPQLAVGVWVGNMDGKLMRAGADGSVVAGPIWNQFMRKALAGKPVENFARPSGIVEMEVDSITGLLPTAATYAAGTGTKIEKFASFALPTESDPLHRLIKINRQNGLLATTSTPSDLVETRLYCDWHSERPDNSDWENAVLRWAAGQACTFPPTEKDGSGDLLEEETAFKQAGASTAGLIEITKPKSNQAIEGQTDITVEVDSSLKSEVVELYLRNNSGTSIRVTGEADIREKNGQTTYNISWTPPSSLNSGDYWLYAVTSSGETSNEVRVRVL